MHSTALNLRFVAANDHSFSNYLFQKTKLWDHLNMRILSSRTLILLNPYSSSPILFLYSITGRGFNWNIRGISSGSFSASSSSFPPPSRKYNEENKEVKVSVWWDFENCSVPVGVNAYMISNRITSTLRSSGIKGPVTITAFGDVSQLSRSNQEALSATGICLTHVPCGGKNGADKSLLIDLGFWLSQNPPPAHLLLISGDRDFANILHRLRMKNYNILLASKEASGVLCSAASIMWSWNGLVQGDNLSGKHFNHPPDGVYGSWYGHYKEPLLDPFVDTDHPTCSQPKDFSESGEEPKPRAVPSASVNQIRQILKSYPKGLNIVELHTELVKNHVYVDKDFFGYQKFSCFLLSMPNIFRLQHHSSDEGQSIVHGIPLRSKVVVGSNQQSSAGMEGIDLNQYTSKGQQLTFGIRPKSAPLGESDLKSTGDTSCSITADAQGKPMSPQLKCEDPVLTHEENDTARLGVTDGPKDHNSIAYDKSSISPSLQQEGEPFLVHGNTDMCSVDVGSTSEMGNESVAEEGLFRKIWRAWFGNRNSGSSVSGNNVTASCSASVNTFGKGADGSVRSCGDSEEIEFDEKASKLQNSHEPVGSTLSTLEAGKLVLEDKAGFLSQITRWYQFWVTREERPKHESQFANQIKESRDIDGCGASCENVNLIHHQAHNHDLFSKAYFWDELESFLFSPKGLALISRSRNRKQMVRELQKEGPLILNSLHANQYPQLVDMLISEKNWLEECSSDTFSFKLKITAKRSFVSPSCVSNGLSSIFACTSTHSQLRGRMQHGLEGQGQDLGPVGNANVSKKQPRNLADLKLWLQKFHNGTGKSGVEDIKRHFEKEFNQKLDCGFYGYSTIEDLLAACSSNDNDSGKSSKNASNMSRSRLEIIDDCHKLLPEILAKHPEGFNVGSFKPMFLEKYGYCLDYQMLCYTKLAYLLRGMPGVKLVSNFILPADKVPLHISPEKSVTGEVHNSVLETNAAKMKSSDELAHSAGRSMVSNPSADQDSVWEELGPVSETVTSCNVVESRRDEPALGPKKVVPGDDTGLQLNGKNSNEEMDGKIDYNAAVISDEEFSDSEGENLYTDKLKGEDKQSSGKENSSLLQILDLWYGKDRSTDLSTNPDGLLDCSTSNRSEREVSSAVGGDNSVRTANLRRKLKPRRRYTFVSDPGHDEKEKFIDSILVTLKKSSDSRMQS